MVWEQLMTSASSLRLIPAASTFVRGLYLVHQVFVGFGGFELVIEAATI
jgi:hypothetical protein